MSSVRPAGVTFDYWNTLMVAGSGFAPESRAEIWVDHLHDHGREVTIEEVAAVVEDRRAELDRRWKAGEHYGPDEILVDTASALGVTDESFIGEVATALEDLGRRAPIQLADGVAGVFRRLRSAGIRIGIVCDVGQMPSTVLRHHLERHDVGSYIDAVAFSDSIGVYKPDGRIFHHALETMGVGPRSAAHVGDLRRTDVAGARALGMVSVRYAGLFDDRSPHEEASHVISHHDQLPAALGIPT